MSARENQPSGGPPVTELTYAALSSRGPHTGMVQSLLCDGSVKSISDNIDGGTWLGLGTRSGGEVVGEF